MSLPVVSKGKLHLIFWVAVLVFYTFFFGYRQVSFQVAFSLVIVLLPVTVAATYFLNYVLVPKYLLRKKYGAFFLYFIYTLIVSFYLDMLIVIGIFILVAQMQMDAFAPSVSNAMMLIAGMYVVVFLGVAIRLVNLYNKNQVQIQQLKGEKIAAELKFLKSQLHPHFLFNTLNNLYSLTLEKSDNAPDVVLKLSELLDYVLYDCSADFVPLHKEVRQMKNYAELEKLRYGNRLSIEFSEIPASPNLKIPPMTLMTLLENSFKHGVSKSIKNSWIKIDFSIDGDQLICEVSNSISTPKQRKAAHGGIGLSNLKNRLQLLYKSGYHLSVQRHKHSFHARLNLLLN